MSDKLKERVTDGMGLLLFVVSIGALLWLMLEGELSPSVAVDLMDAAAEGLQAFAE